MTRKQRRFFTPAPRATVNNATDRATARATEHSSEQAGDRAAWGPSEALPVDAVGLDEFDPEFLEPDEIAEQRAPSLPIIFFSAASGVAGGVIALFVSYRWLQWGVELSAGLATLALLFSLGISGAILSAATGSRAAPVNILFSCGVILLAIFFLALCLLTGALVGTVLVRL